MSLNISVQIKYFKQSGRTFKVNYLDWAITLSWQPCLEITEMVAHEAIEKFLAAVTEEQFLHQYFYQVPLSTIQAQTWQTTQISRLGTNAN